MRNSKRRSPRHLIWLLMTAMFAAAMASVTSKASESAELLSPGTYEIDTQRSEIGFRVGFMLFLSQGGKFHSFNGRIKVAEPFEKSEVDASVDLKSLDTESEKRDAHLKTADFFDADRFPTMTFRSRRLAGRKDAFTMTGDLTIHGVTREVVFDCHSGARTGAISATAEINRQEFGVSYGVPIKNTIRINLTIVPRLLSGTH